MNRLSTIYTIVSILLILSIITTSISANSKFIKTGQMYGPCPINGITGNGNLTVGVDKRGTIVLLSWPKPSYYDQVNYLTISDKLPDFGVKKNMGIFAGLIYDYKGKKSVSWFKSDEWKHDQRYLNNNSNVLITEYTNKLFKVISYMFVVPDMDVLINHFNILSKVEGANNISLIFFENLNPCNSKIPFFPISDWGLDWKNDFAVLFDGNEICHFRPSSIFGHKNKGVYIYISGSKNPSSYQCGVEFSRHGSKEDAYRDAMNGSLSKSPIAFGSVDSAMTFPLKKELTIYLAVGKNRYKGKCLIEESKSIGYISNLNRTISWWKNWISIANLPYKSPPKILNLTKRSLITIRMGYDSDTGAIVASPSKQAPYSEDWPRDGSFINYALDLAGYYNMTEKHNLFYCKVQKQSGRWSMCYYSDGEAGGPIPFEIDQVGFAIWSLFEHYKFTKDLYYLKMVYPSIKRAANLLTLWKDPKTGLPLPANEDDNPRFRQTIRGASPVLLGIREAIEAGKLVGENSNLIRLWTNRERELENAIDKFLWNGKNYGDATGGGSTLIWPLQFKSFENPRMKIQESYIYKSIINEKNSEKGNYGYVGREIVSLSFVWKNREETKELLNWFYNISTDGTHLFGERYKVEITNDDNINYINYIAVPHLWTHALFYISAMFVYG